MSPLKWVRWKKVASSSRSTGIFISPSSESSDDLALLNCVISPATAPIGAMARPASMVQAIRPPTDDSPSLIR